VGANEEVYSLAERAKIFKTPDNKDITEDSVASYLEAFFQEDSAC